MHDYTMDLIVDKKPSVSVGHTIDDEDSDDEGDDVFEDKKFSLEDREDCEWAAEESKILCNEIILDCEVRLEEALKISDGSKRLISFGYCDLNGASNKSALVLDYKSGLDYRPDMHYYEPQLKTYALALFQANPSLTEITCIELYLKPRKKKIYVVTRTQCEIVVAAALKRRKNPERYPVLNDYCHFCGRLSWCPAVNKIAWRTVELYVKAMGQEELFAVPENIQCGEIAAQALTIVKKVFDPLAKRIKAAALELSEKMEIPYYVKSKSNPRKKVVDVRAAFDRLPLTNTEFSRGLSASLKEISEVYAGKYKTSIVAARDTVEGLLSDLIVIGESKPTLKAVLHNQTKKRRGA